MKYKYFALFLCLTLPLVSLRATMPQELLNTFVQRLQPKSWDDGQYRYRVLSFWQRDREVSYIDFTIYPRPGVRSVLLVGKVTRQGQTLLFSEQKQVQILVRDNGLPTPFRLKQRKHRAGQVQQRQRFAIISQTLQLGSEPPFVHYGQHLRQAQQRGDIRAAMDLFMLNTYLLQSQLEYFGSVKMLRYDNFILPGLISGQARLKLERRGFIGLGNTGLWFALQDFQQLAQIQLNGRFFGGAANMEGQLQLSLNGLPVFAVDYSAVEIKNGHVSGGFYRARFLSNMEQNGEQRRRQQSEQYIASDNYGR